MRDILFCVLLLTLLRKGHVSENYCSSEICNNTKQHILCKFQSQEPAPRCVDYEKIIKTDTDKQVLLDKINSRRNKVAYGEIRSLPSAGGMFKVIWNEELETSAQSWANQCVEQSVPDVKDSCRDLGDTLVGQNIATIYGDSPGLTPTVLVDMWYMELLNINSSIISNYEQSIRIGLPHYDYFTQLVWAESYQIGCGGVKFKELIQTSNYFKKRTVYRLVCNFAPGGNRVGSPVYTNGVPCSQCPFGTSCDSGYRALCDPKLLKLDKPTKRWETTSVAPSVSLHNSMKTTVTKQSSVQENVKTDTMTYKSLDAEEYTPFDYFSHLHEYTRQFITVSEKPSSCKDNLAVDDFVELLKKKLSSDPNFRDIIKSNISVSNGNTESIFTDASVAAFVNRIYSKPELPVTTKFTETDYVNSTLLVDLVEAVIFRSADKHTPMDDIDKVSLSAMDVTPVKVQVEFPETKSNVDFTGHYFFPEDDEDEIKTEMTEAYYDNSNIPLSDVILEIEDIRRKTTRDFLDDILETDVTENTVSSSRLSPDDMNIFISGKSNMKNFLKEMGERNQDGKRILKRKKRQIKINNITRSCKNAKYYSFDENVKLIKSLRSSRKGYEQVTIIYNDLLSKMASDIEILKLNERYHCSRNRSVNCLLSTSKSILLIASFLMFLFCK